MEHTAGAITIAERGHESALGWVYAVLGLLGASTIWALFPILSSPELPWIMDWILFVPLALAPVSAVLVVAARREPCVRLRWLRDLMGFGALLSAGGTVVLYMFFWSVGGAN